MLTKRILARLIGAAGSLVSVRKREILYLVAFIIVGILTILVNRLDLTQDDPLIRMFFDEMMRH